MAILATLTQEYPRASTRNICKCDKCGHVWIPRKSKIPRACPSCSSILWNRPRKRCTWHKRGPNAERVIEAVSANPCIYNAKVGQTLGISRERVRQIRERAGLPKRPSSQSRVYCLNCGNETVNQFYCCRVCEHEYTHPLVECHNCGILFRRLSYHLIQGYPYFFHNKSCRAKFYLGKKALDMVSPNLLS